VITLWWPGAGRSHQIEGTMSHDKIKAAARKRMAETGESYAAARREVIREFQAAGNDAPTGGPERFAISYKDMGRFPVGATP
jgi:hypothetical protein